MSTDVGVGELVEELEQRGGRLPFEIGAYVALEACEGLLRESVKLDTDDVRVTVEGSVVVAPSAERAAPNEAARSLLSVLSRLLVAAGPGVPPHLLQLVRESVTEETESDLRKLHDAIEASLIPLNRSASRRVLARLVRESDLPPSAESPTIDAGELDAELDELLGTPASRLEAEPSLRSRAASRRDERVTARIQISEARLALEAARRAARPPANGPDRTPFEAAHEAWIPEPSVAAIEPPAESTDESTPTAESASPPALQAGSASASTPPAEPVTHVTPTAPPPSSQGARREAGLEAAAEPELQEPMSGRDRDVSSGAVVVSEEARVSSVPPPFPHVQAAPAYAMAPAEPADEAISATIRVRFPEEEPKTAEVAVPGVGSIERPWAADASVMGPASEAVIGSATETTRMWSTVPPLVDGPEGVTRGSEPEVEPAGSNGSTPSPRASTAPAQAPTIASSTTLPPAAPVTSKRRALWAPWLLVLGAAIGVYALVANGLLGGGFGTAPQVTSPSGTVEVSVSPADSQIFVFVGRGPAAADGLAVGAPHEFVVFDRGLEPSRAIVPQGATWALGQGGSLYELAVQARAANPDAEGLGLGLPLTEPTSSSDTSGTVRVITNPPGAKVYRLVGLGPKAVIPVGSIHEGHEILVYHSDHSPRRAVIGPSDWPDDLVDERYRTQVEVVLPELSSAATKPSDD